MCGFIVWYNKKSNVNSFKLEKAMALQNHRGPDYGSSIYFDSKYKKTKKKHIQLAFAHKRLSIIDLSKKSNQPYIGNDKKNCLVYNGEIYNYLELKKELQVKNQKFYTTGDTEILYNVLLNYDKNFVNKLNGMWSFVFFSLKKRELIFSRDIVGQKPLYYYRDNDNLIISTEAKSIFFILNGDRKREASEEYLLNFFNTGRLTKEIHFYKSIKKAEPGSIITFNLTNNKLIFNKKNYLIQNDVKDYSVEKIDHEIKCSMERHLRSDRKIACLVSGGVDSSLICSMASRIKKDLSFYTLSTNDKSVEKGFKEDMAYSSYLSKKLGVKLIKVQVDDENIVNIDFLKSMTRIYDYPVNITGTGVGLNLVYKRISEDGIKVILNGTGSDEIFGGYPKFLIINLRKSFLSKNPFKIFNSYKDFLFYDFSSANKHFFNSSKALLKLLIKGNLYHFNIFHNYLKAKFKKEFLNSEKINKYNPSDLIAMQEYEIYRNQLQTYTHECDSNSMMYSTESRSPFLDATLIKYVNLKTKEKFKNGYNKFLLRKILNKYDKRCAWRNSSQGASFNSNKFSTIFGIQFSSQDCGIRCSICKTLLILRGKNP